MTSLDVRFLAHNDGYRVRTSLILCLPYYTMNFITRAHIYTYILYIGNLRVILFFKIFKPFACASREGTLSDDLPRGAAFRCLYILY